ncbi:MAG: DUF2095 domain-containing protein [Aigarchaeota archaeon]|nr:DUF2095 domain-containing protein [Candidatus Pelearchaeum maunauluense]
MPEFTVDELRRMFPHLFQEIQSRRMALRFSGMRSSPEAAERDAEAPLPTAVGYLRRCYTDEEARDVIRFLRQRGEISDEEAERLEKQLEEHGVRSLGSKKEPGYYLQNPPR